MAVSTYLSIINVNRLIAPIKRHRMTEWLKKSICCQQRLASNLKTHTDWMWKDRKRYSTQMEEKKVKIAILISYKIDFENRKVRGDKGH